MHDPQPQPPRAQNTGCQISTLASCSRLSGLAWLLTPTHCLHRPAAALHCCGTEGNSRGSGWCAYAPQSPLPPPPASPPTRGGGRERQGPSEATAGMQASPRQGAMPVATRPAQMGRPEMEPFVLGWPGGGTAAAATVPDFRTMLNKDSQFFLHSYSARHRRPHLTDGKLRLERLTQKVWSGAPACGSEALMLHGEQPVCF